MRGVDHVVAGLEREGHARGVHALGATAVARRARREVGNREHAQVRRGYHDARGHRRVREGHRAAAQGRHGTVGVWGGHGHVILGSRAQRFRKGNVLVGEAQLERLSGTAVRRGEHHTGVVINELANNRDEFGVGTGHVGLAHLELRRHRTTHPEDGREGQALLAPKVHLARAGVEPVRRDVSRGGRGRDVVHGPLAVVEKRTRLREHHEGIFRDVLDGAGRAAVEHGEVLLERRLSGARLDGLKIRRERGVVLGAVVERLLGAGDGLVGEGHLAAGNHVNGVQLADGLARGGHHAAHTVNLVAKELDAHRRGCLRGEHVDGVSMHVKGSGCSHVLGIAHVRVAHPYKQGRHVLEGNLVPHGEGARGKVARARRRHATQERRRRGHHDALLARSQTGNRTAAGADHGVVGGGLGPRVIAAHGIAGNDVLAKPGGKRPGGAICRLLARDNNKAGTRVSRPESRDHQRAGALPHGEGGVIAAAQLVEERDELRRREQLARDPVDKHEGNSLGTA